MNKTELVAALAEKTGASKKDTDNTINAFTEVIIEALKRDGKVQLPGFGTFELRIRAARTGRSPHTGETIEITAAKVPAFESGKALKDVIQ